MAPIIYEKTDEILTPYETLLEMASQEKDGDRFVREVTLHEQPILLCFTDRQVNDIKRFCIEAEQPEILVVDTTFKVAGQYASFTTYRHPVLRTKKTDVAPVFCGPVMFHQHPPSYRIYH